MKFSTDKILFLGLLIFIVTSITSVGYHHSDEHWQLLEFANFKLGRSPQFNLASEYSKEMRSAFQPAVAVLIIQGCESINLSSPFDIALVLRLLSCFLGWIALSVIVKRSNAFGITERNKMLLAAVSMLLWFVPYTSCRFSNENWAGIFFCLGAVTTALNESNDTNKSLLAGVLVGLSYLCRFQLAFGIVGLFGWVIFVKRIPFLKLFPFVIGLLLIVGVGFIFDYWFYGHFTFTAYNYFYANIVDGVAATFGVSPWWYYFKMIFESAAIPLSIIILLGYLYSLWKSPWHVFHMIVFFFVLGHCLVGHKELRFLFPMIYFLPVLLVLGYQKAEESKYFRLMKHRALKALFGLVVFENIVLLFVIVFFKPAEETTLFNRAVYNLASKHPTTIFYYNEDPYQFGDQRQYFYFPKGLKMKKIENDSTIILYKKSVPNQQLFVFDDKFYPSPLIKGSIAKPIFKTFPEWVSYFNFGNWLGRAKAWSLYEVK